MTTLRGRLRERASAVAGRWLSDTLATYSEGASAAFGRQQDPFANPVGAALRRGTRAVVDGLVEGKDAGEICSRLEDVIKIRAVQEFTPSQALGFVFALKEVLRAELAIPPDDPALVAQWADLERQIDRVALGAFDAYMRYRTQLCELRINEVKRSIAVIVERLNRRRPSPGADEEHLPAVTPASAETQRGGSP
jgi:hypothetical protein